MKRQKLKPLLMATGFLTLVGCSTHNSQPSKTDTAAGAAGQKPPAAWTEKMQSLSTVMSDLIPLVASQAKFNEPKNFDRITNDTQQLKVLAHSLKSTDAPNLDPSLPVVGVLFEDDINRALQSLKSGNRDYARGILNDTTAYCIQCHTETANGPDFPRLKLNINTSELNPLERAEFFAATRQFDRALDSYTEVLSSQAVAKADPFQWEQAARAALAIEVRVKNEPKATAELINKMKLNSALPESTKKSILSWEKEVQEWAKEKPPKIAGKQPRKHTKGRKAMAGNATREMTAPEKLQLAEKLIASAQKNQEFPLDHSQDISYFRASALLHDVLSNTKTELSTKAHVLFLSGIAAEATRDMNFWTLHETYYEMCIRTAPHSSQAKECLEKLKDSVTLGYSGSGGVQIPPEVAKRLADFESAAGPEARMQAHPESAQPDPHSGTPSEVQ